jgi:hypothetical protein
MARRWNSNAKAAKYSKKTNSLEFVEFISSLYSRSVHLAHDVTRDGSEFGLFRAGLAAWNVDQFKHPGLCGHWPESTPSTLQSLKPKPDADGGWFLGAV